MGTSAGTQMELRVGGWRGRCKRETRHKAQPRRFASSATGWQPLGQPGREEQSASHLPNAVSAAFESGRKEEKQKTTSAGEDVEKLEPVCIASGNVKLCHIVETVWQVLKLLSIELPYDPAIPLLGMAQRN